MKNLNELAKEITLREGKKKSLTIAQVKEVLGILSDVFYGQEGYEAIVLLFKNGKKRVEKCKMKKKS